jgi:hypothetical protein
MDCYLPSVFYDTEVILHEPYRHEEDAFDVQALEVVLDYYFAIEVFCASDFTGCHLRHDWKRRHDNLSHARRNASVGYGLSLSYFYICRTLFPD